MPSHTPAERRKNRKRKNPITQAKAKKILREKKPTLRGKPITKKQRGFLGVRAGGGKLTRLKPKNKK